MVDPEFSPSTKEILRGGALKRDPHGRCEIQVDVYKSPNLNYPYPDWILFVDDDTWFNPISLPKTLSKSDQSIPTAIAPALLHGQENLNGPTTYYGGGGLAVNRVLLEQMTRPVYCHGTQSNGTIQCDRLRQAGFISQFQNGMSLVDFMVALLSRRISCLVVSDSCMSCEQAIIN